MKAVDNFHSRLLQRVRVQVLAALEADHAGAVDDAASWRSPTGHEYEDEVNRRIDGWLEKRCGLQIVQGSRRNVAATDEASGGVEWDGALCGRVPVPFEFVFHLRSPRLLHCQVVTLYAVCKTGSRRHPRLGSWCMADVGAHTSGQSRCRGRAYCRRRLLHRTVDTQVHIQQRRMQTMLPPLLATTSQLSSSRRYLLGLSTGCHPRDTRATLCCLD